MLGGGLFPGLLLTVGITISLWSSEPHHLRREIKEPLQKERGALRGLGMLELVPPRRALSGTLSPAVLCVPQPPLPSDTGEGTRAQESAAPHLQLQPSVPHFGRRSYICAQPPSPTEKLLVVDQKIKKIGVSYSRAWGS